MTRIIADTDIESLLSMAECVQAMEVAFADYGNGIAANIPRQRYICPTGEPSYSYWANVHLGAVPSLGTAAVRVGHARRHAAAADSGPEAPLPYAVAQHDNRNWGFICLIDLKTCQPLAFIQKFTLSGIREGATTGLAARYLAREDAASVGLFGSGKLARVNLEALAVARPLRIVKVFSPSQQHREGFAREMSAKLEIEVTPVDDPREAVQNVDIVCCTTNASVPVFDGGWLKPGQLVISNRNSDVHHKQAEVDETTFISTDALYINDKESVFSNGQKELLDPIEQGLFTWDKIHELGELVIGRAPGRTRPEELLFYKNNSGMGIQMAAAGRIIYDNAVTRGIGQEIPTEWFGSDLSSWYEKGFYPSP